MMNEDSPPRSHPSRPLAPAAPAPVRDLRGRALRDLRVSVTDRCNFRCRYCMPKGVFGKRFQFLERAELLSFGEIHRLVRLFRDHGVQKVRLTGGEPLLRRHLERLVEMLAYWDDLDLTLTTNGSLLKEKARDLRAAGLRRVTVSLDSLDDGVFKRMNDVNFSVANVLQGIEAAAAAGLAPIKINMVVQRGVNEDSVLPMARFMKAEGHILRIIEFMDVGATNRWKLDEVVPSRAVAARIAAELPIEPIDAQYPGEVAERWRYTDGDGEVGFISSVTQAFCHSCTRARLSAKGHVYTCLFATHGTDFRAPIRSGASDSDLAAMIRTVWGARDDRYSELRGAGSAGEGKIEMSYIGG
jgi:cyclic pyranopterin phosphate synthase